MIFEVIGITDHQMYQMYVDETQLMIFHPSAYPDCTYIHIPDLHRIPVSNTILETAIKNPHVLFELGGQ